MTFTEWIVCIGQHKLGITHDLVFEDEQPYLERWIFWCGFTVRLHKFHKGDDDRAFHDHPWWFITVPLRSYVERTPELSAKTLSRFRPHFRSAKHQHIVELMGSRPVWTFIITGPKSKEWGFWEKDTFIHHSQWLSVNEPAEGT